MDLTASVEKSKPVVYLDSGRRAAKTTCGSDLCSRSIDFFGFSTMIKPDYHNGGIVNLMSSLTRGLGGPVGAYPPLALLPPAEVARAAHVVLLVIDGLGYDYLQRRDSRLKPYLKGRVTSVFPSSTAPAVTTFLTGAAPQQHAVTGWFMQLKELGTVAVILPFRPRWGDAPLPGEIGALLGQPALTDRLPVQSHFIIYDKLVDTAYSKAVAGGALRWGYRRLDDCIRRIVACVRGARRRSYVYAYWSYFDKLCHQHGVGGAIPERHFRQIEAGFDCLLNSLQGTDTLLILTADHGFIDTAPAFRVELSQHPELADCLAAPLCGEPRAIYCHVRPAKTARFERYIQDCLADSFELCASEELLAQGWFGLGKPDPRLADRIGDYTLIAKDRYILKDLVPGEKPWREVGVHGGVSPEEMYAPLVAVQC